MGRVDIPLEAQTVGQEIECRLRYRRKSLVGKAYLETDYLLFRGEERLKILLSELTSVAANDGCLHLEFSGGPATLELGRHADIWAARILKPPSLLTKLGVKPGIEVAVVGSFEDAFLKEIGPATKKPADLVFFAARKTSDLKKLAAASAQLKPRGALWVVYPKGVNEIREMDVIEAGRSVGMKDTKVARFSATHTALRFSPARTA